MKNLIIFADYGLDDAAATISIFKHHERFEHITIVPIAGNVPADISYRNCLTLLQYYPALLNKITIVDGTHIPQNAEYLAEIHGNDGMGDLFTVPATAPQVETLRYEDWLATLTGDEQVLSLGPMTLVRPLMEKHPFELFIMGGCIREEPNFNGYEFNHCLDTQAFSYCTRFPHIAVTLDTCRTQKLDMRRFNIDGDDLHSQILRADQKLSISREEDGCYVWDDVAACCLLFPDRFSVETVTDPYGNTVNNAVYISDLLYFEDDPQ